MPLAGTDQLRFVEEGHDLVGQLSSDLIIRIKQEPATSFKRVGDNLIFTRQISLEESILAESFEITTLDDRVLFVSIDEIISPQTTTVIKGEGMPILTEQQDALCSLSGRQPRGNLIIRYDIQFPKFLSDAQKKAIESVI